MALDLCLYHVNKSAALNYMLWFENTTATKGPAIGNVTYSQLAQQLSKYGGVNASTINITQCKNELATMTTNSSQLESKALTWLAITWWRYRPRPWCWLR